MGCPETRRTGEWQLEAILATAEIDDAAKARIMSALGPATPIPDAAAIRRIERELRELGTRNALGQLVDSDYFERRGQLLAELDAARSPEAAVAQVDAKSAIDFLTNLQSMWTAEMPNAEAHEEIRHAYERRRAEALAAGFGVLATLGPEIVRIELASDPRTAAPLALSLQREKAELSGDRARALWRLKGGNRSRLH